MNYLFEIGTEEIPARFLQSLINDLVANVSKRLEGIHYKNIEKFATYRRLAFVIYDLAEEQASKNEEIKGPPESIAVNVDGSYTKAGEGFLKKNGVTEGIIKDGYFYAKVFEKGKKTQDILPRIIVDSLADLYLPVAMKWGDEKQKFYRPVHWIVSLLDDKVLPLEFAGISAGNITFGHRCLMKGQDISGTKIKVDFPANYEKILNDNNVEPSFDKRKNLVLTQISKVTDNVSLYAEGLLEEVTGLVENPKILYGEFDKEFLSIPERILTMTMSKHQKYFPVFEKGKLINKFQIVADNVNDKNEKNIIAGNQKVLKARLCDAKFYFEEDTKRDFEFFLNKLKTITFQQKLGSIYDKLERNLFVANIICNKCEIGERELAMDITKYAKADLSTGMVYEFPELQGYIGQQYALKWHFNKSIADGIYEQYLPAFAGDVLPSFLEACIASVADKVETIVGQFVIGKIPSGSQDPFGLRRQANGVLRIFYETDFFPFSIEYLIEKTLSLYNKFDIPKENIVKLYDFFDQRIEQYLKERGIAVDIIQTTKTLNITLLKKRLILFDKLNQSKNKKEILEAIIRVLNITKDVDPSKIKQIDPFLFEDNSERELFDILKTLSNKDVAWDEALIKEWNTLAKAISNFFNAVMVMVEDVSIKNNRLSELYKIREYFVQFGDFKALQV